MIIKCKMCGGDLQPVDQSTTCECEFCGTRQTVPSLDNERKTNLFNRANRLRMSAEFDKAAAVYESIVSEFPEEAEAYWGLCLCAYGIEYVDDPATGEKKPTCHRTLPVSIMEDSNFEQACDNADAIARRVYRDEAKAIDRIQKDIMNIVSTEKPYDVFICYKETAEEGGRTEDSVLGQEIYDELTGKGLKVFFSRISLEDKLGQQYEPYIYAALSSAKVMIAIGTRYEYYDAVWVKNEWMRFLSMMKSDRTKTLIPCYKDLDAYDMPKEFKQLQAQDMNKLGWLQDLVRGVMKLCGKDGNVSGTAAAVVPIQNPMGGNPTVDSLLQRAHLFLEDEKWEEADQYADRALDIEPLNAGAYLVKLMAERKVRKEEQIPGLNDPMDESEHYQKVLRFADERLKKQIIGWNQTILDRNEYKRREGILSKAKSKFNDARTVEDYQAVKKQLSEIQDFQDVAEINSLCDQRIRELEEKARKEAETEKAVQPLWEVLQQKKDEHQQVRLEKLAPLSDRLHKLQNKKEEAASYITAKQAELSNLHGLFIGKKRNELERIITETQRELSELEKSVTEAQNVYESARQSIEESSMEEREIEYRIAETYYKAGVFIKAYSVFSDIRGYKHVDSLLATDEKLIAAATAAAEAREAKLKPWKTVGSYVTFGTYPQTKAGTDATPIEWLVLDVQGNKSLLISRYALDCQPYNTEFKDITWEQCTLRTWLNSEFVSKAFSADEQKAIFISRVDNSNSQGYSGYDTSGGNNTQDKVFLLSYAEAWKFFAEDASRKCAPTDYAAVAQGEATSSSERVDGKAAGDWWLRSPGYAQRDAACVNNYGSCYSSRAYFRIKVVRPAFWINLKSDIF